MDKTIEKVIDKANVNENKKTIKISVRNLVEFILREGDIDNRLGGGADKEAMQLGSKIHRKLQRRMGAEYKAEVSLKQEVDCEEFILSVEGRADGIIENEEKTMIDEIKGVMRDLMLITKPVPVHLAQAKCYAYIWGKKKELEQIAVQMTYCNLETEEIKYFQEEYAVAELAVWFDALVMSYKKWAKFQLDWREKRNTSIKGTEFPFSYREGQKELMTSVYRSIQQKKELYIQAPTGVGKTLATIFPAVKAVGEELGEKIFYLTAKTITRTIAQNAFQLLAKSGLHYKVLTLTAKEKICPLEEMVCNPDSCPYAKGHYTRVNEVVFELLQNEEEMSREAIEKYALEGKVCPYEMSLDISLWVDVVICDYNYVFDPVVYLRRFFAEGNKGEYLFLIDEAHNLVERGREMFSAKIYKEELLEVKKLVKTISHKLTRSLESCNKLFLAMKKECETYQIQESVTPVAMKLLTLQSEMEKVLEEHQEFEGKEYFLEFYFKVYHFMAMYERMDENYIAYSEYENNGKFFLKLLCVNPSVNLRKSLDMGNAAIFFSATLLPVTYYKSLLGGDEDAYAVYAKSTFDIQNRLLLVGSDVTTKYTQRGKQMYAQYAGYILKVMQEKKGNYIAFFPSYRFLEEVLQEYLSLREEYKETAEYIVQAQYMDEVQREEFLAAFEEEKNGLLAFCVLGGIFSEGIDLIHNQLIGTFIIGTGIPQIGNEREIIKNYFFEKNMEGFDFAYRYPGMNKVMQAAGRVIRTDNDCGTILLLDYRFLESAYQKLFPLEWKAFEVSTIERVQEKTKAFWKEKK